LPIICLICNDKFDLPSMNPLLHFKTHLQCFLSKDNPLPSSSSSSRPLTLVPHEKKSLATYWYLILVQSCFVLDWRKSYMTDMKDASLADYKLLFCHWKKREKGRCGLSASTGVPRNIFSFQSLSHFTGLDC